MRLEDCGRFSRRMHLKSQKLCHTVVQPASNRLKHRRSRWHFALDGAAHAVDAVRAGGALPAALARIFTRIDAPAARGAIQDLACRALRALGRTDALIATLVRRPPP